MNAAAKRKCWHHRYFHSYKIHHRLNTQYNRHSLLLSYHPSSPNASFPIQPVQNSKISAKDLSFDDEAHKNRQLSHNLAEKDQANFVFVLM